MNQAGVKSTSPVLKTFMYAVCIIFALLSIWPFYTMFINSTRGTFDIQQGAFSLLPSDQFFSNLDILLGLGFNPLVGFMNSAIISVGAVIFALYFSSITAYALVAYQWKMRQPFFVLISIVMMIPAQMMTIGFFRFMISLGMTNSFLPLILPAIASPVVVFFMRQYLLATFSPDIVNSARIDGASEFRIFNTIMLPIMKPAIATQAIFVFVASWNNFFMPLVLLTDRRMHTMPIMVSLLQGDIYRTEFGSVYLALALSVIPLFIIYFALSKYIIAGVMLGGVKE